MIIGYDLGLYSFGTGPFAASKGWTVAENDSEREFEAVMREIMRGALLKSRAGPRCTSIVATLHWGDDQQRQMRAGLIDREWPAAAPMSWQEAGMEAFRANVWVGDEPLEFTDGRTARSEKASA